MNKINLPPVSEWKSFLLADYFDMKGGKYHPKEMGEIDLSTPLVSASERDNGITSYVSGKPMFAGNALTIGKVGCVVNYQASPFSCTGDVVALMPKSSTPFNVAIGLFLKSIIHSESPKWSYGRQIRLNNCQRLVVKLPASKDGNPDWQLMEDYMKSLDANVAKVDKAPVFSEKVTLPPVTEWKSFRFDDVFNISKGKSLTKVNMTNGKTPYVGASDKNNGVTAFVGQEPTHSGNKITVANNGSVGESFYQETAFWCSSDVSVIDLKERGLNGEIALFLISLIKAEKFKFSYGRKWNKERMERSQISLPIDADGNPDWQLMEEYIKSLPFSRSL